MEHRDNATEKNASQKPRHGTACCSRSIPDINKKKFQQNLHFLRSTDPLLYQRVLGSGGEELLEKASDGTLTLRVKNQYLESRYHPSEAAARYIPQDIPAGSSVVFLGSGLGYHINHLLKRGSYRGVLIEKDLRIFRAALFVLEPRLLQDLTLLIAAQKVKKKGQATLYIVKHPGCTRVYRNYYNYVEKLLLEELKSTVASSATTRAYGSLWIKNIVYNLCRAAVCKKPVRSSHRSSPRSHNTGEAESNYYQSRFLSGRFKGPVILVSSGPFLEQVITALRRWSRNLPVIALLPSVRYLLENGIKPDFVVTTDAGFANRYRLIRSPDIPLIAPFCCDPVVVKNWMGEVFLFSHLLSFEQNLEVIRSCSIGVPMQGTSSVVMVLLARVMGFDRIFLAGYDFAYSGMKDHHRGGGFQSYLAARSRRLNTLPTLYYKHLRDQGIMVTEDQYGGEIYTSHKLGLYKRWLESEVRRDDLYRLNNGAKLEGVELADAELLDSYNKHYRVCFQERKSRLEKRAIPARKIEEELAGLSRKVSEGASREELHRFFYGSVEDKEVINRGVDEALRALEKGCRYINCISVC
ncbi:MAG: motility associated factor glycosyltransferase family protein [Spirochaetota bacterium]